MQVLCVDFHAWKGSNLERTREITLNHRQDEIVTKFDISSFSLFNNRQLP